MAKFFYFNYAWNASAFNFYGVCSDSTCTIADCNQTFDGQLNTCLQGIRATVVSPFPQQSSAGAAYVEYYDDSSCTKMYEVDAYPMTECDYLTNVTTLYRTCTNNVYELYHCDSTNCTMSTCHQFNRTYPANGGDCVFEVTYGDYLKVYCDTYPHKSSASSLAAGIFGVVLLTFASYFF